MEELQYALSVMGIDKSPAEVQELMDSVDKDGSGGRGCRRCCCCSCRHPEIAADTRKHPSSAVAKVGERQTP